MKIIALFAQRRRQSLLKRLPEGALRDALRHPVPAQSSAWNQVEYLALDFETTGLDAGKHELLSMGFVPVRQERVILNESRYLLVQPERPIPAESVAIHGLTDDLTRQQGIPLEEAMKVLLQAMGGRVPLVHYAALERAFLRHACRRLYGASPPLPMVDTMALELHRLKMTNHTPDPKALRLPALRARYGLPRYRMHNALADAIGVAELFLAQMAYQEENHGKQLLLGEILSW